VAENIDTSVLNTPFSADALAQLLMCPIDVPDRNYKNCFTVRTAAEHRSSPVPRA
jgi:hypothetical protein